MASSSTTHHSLPNIPESRVRCDNGGSTRDDLSAYWKRVEEALEAPLQRAQQSQHDLAAFGQTTSQQAIADSVQDGQRVHADMTKKWGELQQWIAQRTNQLRVKYTTLPFILQQDQRKQEVAQFQAEIARRKQALQKEQDQARLMLKQNIENRQRATQSIIKQRVKTTKENIQNDIANAKKQLFEPIERYAQNRIKLNDDQLKSFETQGFLVVSPDHFDDFLYEPVVDLARQRVNFALSEGFTGEELALSFRRPKHEASKEITNALTATPLLSCARSLLGQDTHPTLGGQIAVRFPGFAAFEKNTHPGLLPSTMEGDDASPIFAPFPNVEKTWHIDGRQKGTVGEWNNFSLLCGILLDDCDKENSGNLTVYPQAHKVLGQHYHTNGAKEQPNQPLPKHLTKQFPKPPMQIKGKKGTLVFLHYLMPHTVAPNCGPNIRYALYFRLSALSRPAHGFFPDSMENMWKDFMWKKD